MDDSNYLVNCDDYPYRFMKVNRINGDTIWTKYYYNAYRQPLKMGINRYVCFGINLTPNLTVFDENMDTLYTKSFPWPTDSFYGASIIKTKDGGFAYIGYFEPNPNNYTIRWLALVKTDSLLNTISTSIFDAETGHPITFFPNPATSELNISNNQFATEKNISFSITDMQGKQVLQQQYEKDKPIVVSQLPNGICIAELKAKDKVVREKIIVQHLSNG